MNKPELRKTNLKPKANVTKRYSLLKRDIHMVLPQTSSSSTSTMKSFKSYLRKYMVAADLGGQSKSVKYSPHLESAICPFEVWRTL